MRLSHPAIGPHVAEVVVRDRLLGFDLLGDTLVTLVERPDRGAVERVRGYDWYRITGSWRSGTH